VEVLEPRNKEYLLGLAAKKQAMADFKRNGPRQGPLITDGRNSNEI
jgi:hypothetical protein